MNRAERRRLEKAQAKTYTVTHDDMMYEKGFQHGVHVGILRETGMATRLYTTCMAAVLHDEFGFGKQRLIRVLEHVSATLQAVQGDLDHEKKMRDWIKRECDVDLDDYTGARVIDLREEMQTMHDMARKVGSDK